MSNVTKVLLADDDKDDREIFSDMLADVDKSVVYEGVKDGMAAIEALANKKTKPDIIFVDINMPVMNGWDLLKELKSNIEYEDIPVIIYSTSTGARERKTALDLGALCFVTKPESVKLIRTMLEIVVTNLKKNDVSPNICAEIQRSLRQY